MTLRAILIGLLLGLVIAAFGFYNDRGLNQSSVASDLVPISVYGLMLLGLLLVNPLLMALRQRPFRAGEMAILAAILLAACVIPGPGLMWNFSYTMVMPYYHQNYQEGWQKVNVVLMAPPNLLVDPGTQVNPKEWTHYGPVVDGFRNGLGSGQWLNPAQVPWSAWRGPLAFWLPILALTFIAGTAVVVIIHKQWAHRERLRYPIAIFATELLTAADPKSPRSILRNRLFWLGLGIALVVLLINGLHEYFPKVPLIEHKLRMKGFFQKWPGLQKAPFQLFWYVFVWHFFFVGIGLAYLVSSDVSFSIGISNFLALVVYMALMTAGADMSSDYLEGGLHNFQLFGSYLALGVMVIYLGRRYYGSVLARMFCLPAGEKVEGGTLWAGWIALLSVVGIILMMIYGARLNVPLAVLFVLLTGMMLLVLTRISVETGLFQIQPTWQAAGILLAIFGIKVLGPNLLLALSLLSLVLTVDPKVCLMPFVANALRFGEVERLRPQRVARWMALAVVAALVVGVGATVYIQYCQGAEKMYNWGSKAAALPFDMILRKLPQFGDIKVGTWTDFDISQWGFHSIDKRFLAAAGVGFLLVVVCSALRLKYTWWPIHPVLFLIWGTGPAAVMSTSFLLGWFLKTVISRLGGGRAYEKGKGFFIGLVAGEMVAGVIWMIVGLTYYLVEGTAGPLYKTHP